MSTHNMQFHDKIKKIFPKHFFFLSYRKNFVGTQNQVRISHRISLSKGQGHKLRNVQSNFNGSNIIGTMEFCSRYGLIKASGQEANSAYLEKYNSIFYILYVESTHYSRLNEAILMCTHNIQFHDKIKKKTSQNIFFLELSEEFRRNSKSGSN